MKAVGKGRESLPGGSSSALSLGPGKGVCTADLKRYGIDRCRNILESLFFPIDLILLKKAAPGNGHGLFVKLS